MTFKGSTAVDVRVQSIVWKWAHPEVLVLRESEPFAPGDKIHLVNEPVWTLTIGYSRTLKFPDPAKNEMPRSA